MLNGIPQPIRHAFLDGIAPVARALIRRRISPNAITTAAGVVVLGSATAFANGAIRLGGLLLLLGGLLDILDGYVARATGRVSVFGAFYDATLDRVGELALFTGLIVWLVHGGVPPNRVTLAIIVAMIALGASFLVSYTRARAEGLGLSCTVGAGQRTERLLLIGVPAVVFGPGRDGAAMFWALLAVGLVAAFTVVQRVRHVTSALHDPSASPPPERPPRADDVRR